MGSNLKCKELLCLLYSASLFLSGTILAIYSVILGYKLIAHVKFVPADTTGPFISILLLGITHLALSWLGIKGATSANLLCVAMFVVFTTVLLILELAIGIWVIVLWAQIDEKSLEIMSVTFEAFVKQGYAKTDWIKLQDELHCCGVYNKSDYSRLGSDMEYNIIACCKSQDSCTNEDIGCKDPLANYMEDLLFQIGTSSFSSGLFQIIGVAAFFAFYKSVKKQRDLSASIRLGQLPEAVNLTRAESTRQNEPAYYLPIPVTPIHHPPPAALNNPHPPASSPGTS